MAEPDLLGDLEGMMNSLFAGDWEDVPTEPTQRRLSLEVEVVDGGFLDGLGEETVEKRKRRDFLREER